MNQLTIFIFSLIAYAASSCDFSTAFCSLSGVTCPSSGNLVTVGSTTYNTGDIDVISFNDLTLNKGDIQNRVAVRNNFYATSGVSVGDKLTDGCGYGLIAGGNLNWSDDGAVYPLTSSFFVGGSFSGPSYLSNQITSCSSIGQSAGCLGSYFDGLFNYWSQFSSTLSVQIDNVQVSYSSGIATLSCNSAFSTAYFIHISSSDFNQITGYSTSGCSASASWVFNLNGDVTFNGNPIQVQGFVIYNILGSGKVTVVSSVSGSIVAPNSDVKMVGGTIYGGVIAGNVSNIVQINSANNCPGGASGASGASGSFCGNSNTGSNSGSNTGSEGLTTNSGSVPVSLTTGNSGNSGSIVNGQSPVDGSGAATLIASFVTAVIALAFI